MTNTSTNEIRYFKNDVEMSIGLDISSQMTKLSTEDELAYINKLIHVVMQLYKNKTYILDEFVNKTKITEVLNNLCDIRLKIISYQQIEKDKL